MPKSKSNKVVHLTQVKKKGKDHKQDLVKQLEEYGEKFGKVYLFDFDHTKSDRIMMLRTRLKEHGRIFSGKNSLVSLALRNLGSRMRTDYDDLIKQVSGHRGLLFTDLETDKLIDLLTDELPEFRAKLLGCAKLTRPTITRSDDDDDVDDEVSSDENKDGAESEDDESNEDDGEDASMSGDDEPNAGKKSKTKKLSKGIATRKRRGMAQEATSERKKKAQRMKRVIEKKSSLKKKQMQVSSTGNKKKSGPKSAPLDGKKLSGSAKTVASSKSGGDGAPVEVGRKKKKAKKHEVLFERL